MFIEMGRFEIVSENVFLKVWILLFDKSEIVFLFTADRIARPILSSYMIYLTENRERIKSENPGLSAAEISKRGSKQWKELLEIEQNKYKIKAMEAQQRYKQSMLQAKIHEAKFEKLLQKQNTAQSQEGQAKIQKMRKERDALHNQIDKLRIKIQNWKLFNPNE